MAITDKPPAGRIINPAVIRAARERGWPATPAALADAAKLGGIELHIAASDEAVAAGLAELVDADRKANDLDMRAREAKKLRAEMEAPQ